MDLMEKDSVFAQKLALMVDELEDLLGKEKASVQLFDAIFSHMMTKEVYFVEFEVFINASFEKAKVNVFEKYFRKKYPC